MRPNESHKKESSYYYAQMSHFLSPKLGTTFPQPSWSCAEVPFPPHHGWPIRQLSCNNSNRFDSECLCYLQLEMLDSLLTLFFTKEA